MSFHQALILVVETGLSTGGNPFAGSSIGVSNPFQAAKPAAPTINQLRSQGTFPGQTSSSGLGLSPTLFPASNSSLLGSSQPGFPPTSFGQEAHLSTNNFSVSSGNNPFSM